MDNYIITLLLGLSIAIIILGIYLYYRHKNKKLEENIPSDLLVKLDMAERRLIEDGKQDPYRILKEVNGITTTDRNAIRENTTIRNSELSREFTGEQSISVGKIETSESKQSDSESDKPIINRDETISPQSIIERIRKRGRPKKEEIKN